MEFNNIPPTMNREKKKKRTKINQFDYEDDERFDLDGHHRERERGRRRNEWKREGKSNWLNLVLMGVSFFFLLSITSTRLVYCFLDWRNYYSNWIFETGKIEILRIKIQGRFQEFWFLNEIKRWDDFFLRTNLNNLMKTIIYDCLYRFVLKFSVYKKQRNKKFISMSY